MNWEALGAIGETLGAVAVFVTLAYLAVQVRHARDEVARSTRQARADSLRQLFSMQLNQPDLWEANSKWYGGTMKGPWYDVALERGLTGREAYLLLQWNWAYWITVEQSSQSIDALGSGERIEFERNVLAQFSVDESVVSQWYRCVKDRLNPNTVRYIDSLLARPV